MSVAKTWDQVLTGMVIVSAAVVDDETFVFGANWDETYTGPNPPRQTKLLACELSEGWSGKRNSNGYDFARTAGGNGQALFSDAAGHVTTFDFKTAQRGMEPDMPVRGTTGVAHIGEHFYAYGLGRSFLRRDAAGEWSVLSGVTGSLKEERAAGQYVAIAGTSDKNIYLALNRKGAAPEIHHWNGKKFTTIALPDAVTSELDPDPIFLWDMCCAADGSVYLSGKKGELLVGTIEGFAPLIPRKERSLPGMNLCWFKEKLYGAIEAGLFVFDANELVWKPAPFVEDENAPVNFPILDANENVMLVAGGFGASIFDGKEWQRIAGDVTPLDRTRLYLMERQVEDLGTLRDIMKDLPKADQ